MTEWKTHIIIRNKDFSFEFEIVHNKHHSTKYWYNVSTHIIICCQILWIAPPSLTEGESVWDCRRVDCWGVFLVPLRPVFGRPFLWEFSLPPSSRTTNSKTLMRWSGHQCWCLTSYRKQIGIYLMCFISLT